MKFEATVRGEQESTTLPRAIEPMLAALVREPFDSPDHIFELKWDGVRALAFIEGGRVRIQSRNLQNITAQYPELGALPRQVRADGVVLDGELVCLDEQGRPSLACLQRRLQQKGTRINYLMRRYPVHYVVFDLLFVEGRPIMGEPLWKRKNLLHSVLEPSDAAQACEFVETDGKAFYLATCRHELEGIVAKEKNSLYFPGRRTSSWVKVKRLRDADFVIGGYSFGGRRKELFSSLLLGLYDGDKLVYVGHVGSGFSQSDLRTIFKLLEPLHADVCPFSEVPGIQKFLQWCRPELVCQVRYGEFTIDRKLRYPVFVRLRDDKSPRECVATDAPGWPQH
jgi:bifunctional non-homologous end joining protein LigD